MLRLIKNRLFGRFIKSKPYTDKHQRTTKHWNEIKSIAFLVDGADPLALRTLLNRLYEFEKSGKKLTFIGYVNKLPPFEDEHIKWITKKDLSWIGIPKLNNIKYFIEKDFDVLINTSLKSIRPLEFIAAYSKAHLRIGLYDEHKTYCYDFMIHVPQNSNTNIYLDQVEHYLNML